MHLPTLLLGASLASSYARQQFGPGLGQISNYLEHINGGQNEDQNRGQNYGQDYGQHQGENKGQNEGQNHGQIANQNGKHNGNNDYDDNYDDDTETYNSYYNDAPSAQPTPAPNQAPVSPPIHSTFVVRPSPAVVSQAPIESSNSDVQSPASGYAYNYPSPEASNPVIYSNAPVASSELPAYQAPAPQPQAYSETPDYADSYQAPAQAPSQAPQPEVHQAPAPAPAAQAPPQPKPIQAPAQEPAPVQESAQEPSEPQPKPKQDTHSPVDNFYGQTPDLSEELPTGPDSLPDSVPSGQSDVAPVDPLQPDTNVAPVPFSNPRHHGQDEGNAFCMGTCHANPAELKCEKPYSEPIFKSSKGCYMCCFTSGDF